jgi:hypothetical protein
MCPRIVLATYASPDETPEIVQDCIDRVLLGGVAKSARFLPIKNTGDKDVERTSGTQSAVG